MPAKEELPSTLHRSGRKAQRTWSKAHDAAVQTYGEGERAHRTAFSALKHTHEKIGDHWEPKDEYGPSDERAERGGPDPGGRSAGGVDASASKQHLYDNARRLGIKGRSKMSKDELVQALQRANDRKAREGR